MKFYKCNHIISLAVRLKLASFAAVAFSIPILLRQPNEIQASEIGVDEDISDSAIPLVLQAPKRKRGRPKQSAVPAPDIAAEIPEDIVPVRASKRLRKL